MAFFCLVPFVEIAKKRGVVKSGLPIEQPLPSKKPACHQRGLEQLVLGASSLATKRTLCSAAANKDGFGAKAELIELLKQIAHLIRRRTLDARRSVDLERNIPMTALSIHHASGTMSLLRIHRFVNSHLNAVIAVCQYQIE
jgi:hypothetical protein